MSVGDGAGFGPRGVAHPLRSAPAPCKRCGGSEAERVPMGGHPLGLPKAPGSRGRGPTEAGRIAGVGG